MRTPLKKSQKGYPIPIESNRSGKLFHTLCWCKSFPETPSLHTVWQDRRVALLAVGEAMEVLVVPVWMLRNLSRARDQKNWYFQPNMNIERGTVGIPQLCATSIIYLPCFHILFGTPSLILVKVKYTKPPPCIFAHSSVLISLGIIIGQQNSMQRPRSTAYILFLPSMDPFFFTRNMQLRSSPM